MKEIPPKLVVFLSLYDKELTKHDTYIEAYEASEQKFQQKSGFRAYKDYNSFTTTLRHYKKK